MEKQTQTDRTAETQAPVALTPELVRQVADRVLALWQQERQIARERLPYKGR